MLIGDPSVAARSASVRVGVRRRRPGHRRRRPRIVDVEAVDRIRSVDRARRSRGRRVAADDDPVRRAEDHRHRRNLVVVDRPDDHPRDRVLGGERVEDEVLGRLQVVQRPLQPVGSRRPAALGRAVRVVVRVEVVLVEQPGADGVEHHLCAGCSAVVIRVLLVIRRREILVHQLAFLSGHADAGRLTRDPLVVCRPAVPARACAKTDRPVTPGADAAATTREQSTILSPFVAGIDALTPRSRLSTQPTSESRLRLE